MSCSKARSLPEVKYIGGRLLSGFGRKKSGVLISPKGKRERRCLRCRIQFSMCHYLGGGLHGRQKRVKAQSESSKSVVNSVLISREMPVFLGFLEIIRVVNYKNLIFDANGNSPLPCTIHSSFMPNISTNFFLNSSSGSFP